MYCSFIIFDISGSHKPGGGIFFSFPVKSIVSPSFSPVPACCPAWKHKKESCPERFYVIGTKFPITQKKTDACMLRTHHLPCHILIVILYVIYLHFAKTIFSRVRVGIFASKYLRILLLLTVSQVISLSHTIQGPAVLRLQSSSTYKI